PQGQFNWRYPNIPPELSALWGADAPNEITRGAVMTFEHEHTLAVDGFAGARVWQALLADAIAGKRRPGGYSYVYVHSSLPQSLTHCHHGHTIPTFRQHTGVHSAQTQ